VPRLKKIRSRAKVQSAILAPGAPDPLASAFAITVMR
jgi:hypothetical protein